MLYDKGLELDEKGLSEREAADVAAFIALLKDRLKLALVRIIQSVSIISLGTNHTISFYILY